MQECQIAAAEAVYAAAARAAPAVEVYSALASRIDALGLDGVWDAKPLLNGPEVKADAVGMRSTCCPPDLTTRMRL